MTERDMKDMVDYIELTNSAIADLSSRPLLQKSAIEKTASAIVGAGLIDKSASAILVKSLQEDPNRALELIEKMASMITIDSVGGHTIGSPANVKKIASNGKGEADRAFLRRLGLS
jgi:hypothetical protein